MVARAVRRYMTQVRRFSPNVWLYLGSTFCVGFATQMLWVLYNLYLKELGFNEAIMGERVFYRGLGTVLIAIPAAAAIDHLRLTRVLCGAAFVSTAAYLGLAFFTDVRLLFAASFIQGVGWTVQVVAAPPFLMRNAAPENRTYVFGVSHAVTWTAGLLGAVLGGQIPQLVFSRGADLITGYRVTLLLGAAVTLSSAYFYARIRNPHTNRSGPVRWRTYLGARNWRTNVRLCLPFALIGLGAGLVIPFLNMYFNQRFALDSAQIGYIYALGQLCTVVGLLAGPVLAARLGLIRTVVLYELVSVPFFLILAYTTSLPWAIAAFLLRGGFMNVCWPLYNHFAMEEVEPEHHAGTNSLLNLSWNVSWMVSARLGGDAITAHGFTPVMVTTTIIYTLMALLTLFMFRRRLGVGIAAEPPHLEETLPRTGEEP